MGESNEPKLTPEAKEAINSYLLKLFAIFGITNFVVLVGALAYLVFILPTQAARQAITRVEDQVDSSIQKLHDKAADAHEEIGRARELSRLIKEDSEKDLKQLSGEALKLQEELTRVRKEVGALKQDDTVKVVEAASVLRENQNVVVALRTLPEIERLKSQVAELKDKANKAEVEQVQSVFGTVGEDGRRIEGKGFKVKSQGAVYIVTFDVPFREVPVVVVSSTECGQPGAGCSDNLVHVSSVHKRGATLLAVDGSGDAEKSSFSFIAIGRS